MATTSHQPIVAPLAGLMVGLVCPLVSGCFDSEAMIEQRRAIAIRTRLEEVDLGKYRVTLPHPEPYAEVAEIQFHAFGQVTNRDLKQVRKAIEENLPLLKHRLLIAARHLEMPQIKDPQLTELRTRITTEINELLPGKPLQSVGFYSFDYVNF